MGSAIRLGAGALVLATFFAGAAQANLVTNPGFETNLPGRDSPAGPSPETCHNTGRYPLFSHSGRFSAFLGTCPYVDEPQCLGSTGSIAQTLATTAGASYDIEFWLNAEVTPNFLSVSFDDVVLDSFTDITTFPDEPCAHPSPIGPGGLGSI